MTATIYYPLGKTGWNEIAGSNTYGGSLTWQSYTDAPVITPESGEAFGTFGANGDNLEWKLKNGVLTISGTGAMENYSFWETTPWYRYRAIITDVTIAEGVTNIGDSAFLNFYNLSSVNIPGSVTSIGSSAFENCYSLSSVNIAEGVTSIGKWTFENCYSLETIKLPNKVTVIEEYAFSGCSSLETITIPENVRSIEKYAFYGCSSLSTISIPSNVTSIKSYAFSNCDKLTQVTLAQGVCIIYDYVFENCSSLTELTIPSSVTSIGHYAFEFCSSLKKVTLSNGLRFLGDSVFAGCSALKELTIPSSVLYIGYHAFVTCDELTLTFEGDAPHIETYAFEESTVTIYYPADKSNWVHARKDGYAAKKLTWIALDDNSSNDSSKDDVDDSKDDISSETPPVEDVGDVPAADIPEGGIPETVWVSNLKKGTSVLEKTITYTGSAIKPEIQVYNHETLLEEGTDYTISYKNNKNVYEEEVYNTKSPQIMIKFKGNYSGTETKTIYFNIERVNISSAAFTAGDLAVKATGKKQSPKPTLLWNGKKLKYGTDFEVAEYSSESYVKAGSYPLTIKGKKGFNGERKITLTISDDKNQIAMSKVSIKGLKSQPWTGKKIEPSDFKVMYKKKVLVEGTDYTVDCGENINIGTGTITITGKDGSSFIGSKTVTFKITGGKLSKAKITGVQKTYPYTGNLIEPTKDKEHPVALTYNGTPLEKDKDYTVTYKKNRNKGTATIIFTGMNGYTGTKKKTFKITASKLGETTIVELPKAKLDGEVYVVAYEKVKGGVKPDVEVKDGDTKLEKGKDYTVSYKNNKKKALFSAKKAPTIIIKGKGNYSGSVTKTFTIE